jgi:hypothetical protein
LHRRSARLASPTLEAWPPPIRASDAEAESSCSRRDANPRLATIDAQDRGAQPSRRFRAYWNVGAYGTRHLSLVELGRRGGLVLRRLDLFFLSGPLLQSEGRVTTRGVSVAKENVLDRGAGHLLQHPNRGLHVFDAPRASWRCSRRRRADSRSHPVRSQRPPVPIDSRAWSAAALPPSEEPNGPVGETVMIRCARRGTRTPMAVNR